MKGAGLKMDTTLILVLSFTVAHSLSSPNSDCKPPLELTLEPHKPILRHPVNSEAVLKCCYERKMAVDYHWVARFKRDKISAPKIVRPSLRVTMDTPKNSTGPHVCHTLTLREVQVNDTGRYWCFLNSSKACLFTNGTYLHVYSKLAHSLPVPDCKPPLKLTLEPDQPSLRLPVNSEAVLKCCYERTTKMAVDYLWVARYKRDNISAPEMVRPSLRVTMGTPKENSTGPVCQPLTLREVQVNDTGLYQCFLNSSKACLFTHGTYLQVYIPLRRTLDISESWKNTIITMEGVLLLFSVLLPGLCQLGKTKRLTQLNKKKRVEEENIYEGLNLDDCNSTYHQIHRSHLHGPYQDVANPTEEDIQLEKP